MKSTKKERRVFERNGKAKIYKEEQRKREERVEEERIGEK